MSGHPLGPLELDALSLKQALVTIHWEGGEMAEVDVPVIACDPAVALLVVPPSHGPTQALWRVRHDGKATRQASLLNTGAFDRVCLPTTQLVALAGR